jgi:hypothetical protein
MTIDVRAVICFFYLLDMPDEDIPARLKNSYKERVINQK